MWVFLRQGSASQNLVALAPSIVAHGTDQAALCTDDREPDTLSRLGHINDCARLAVACGISEIEAILLAATNPARYHRFDHLGSLARATRPTSWRSRRWPAGSRTGSGRPAGRSPPAAR